jgi:hypothetical protein
MGETFLRISTRESEARIAHGCIAALVCAVRVQERRAKESKNSSCKPTIERESYPLPGRFSDQLRSKKSTALARHK